MESHSGLKQYKKIATGEVAQFFKSNADKKSSLKSEENVFP